MRFIATFFSPFCAGYEHSKSYKPAIEPRLLLMDEVMAGLNPSEVREMVGVVMKIRDQGVGRA